MNLLDILMALYRSEINARVETFYDGGLTISLGDEMNGFRETRTLDRESAGSAGRVLHEMAMKHYPQSQYAKDRK